MLDIHRNTAYEWAKKSAAGEDSRFKDVERHPITGYLSIPISEVDRVKGSDGEPE